MIELSEEPYDSDVAQALVVALNDEINERYRVADDFSAEEAAIFEADFQAEVTPELVTRPRGAFLVARLDGRSVGCGALKPFDPPAVGEIKRMYTVPDARRRGVSRVLLTRLEEIAVELGYRRLVLETGTAQPEALELYASAGWQGIEPYGYWKDSPTSLCFAKDLPSG